MKLVGNTHIGRKRSRNEDSILVSNEPIGSLPNLCIVADGMGGHKCGEVASSRSIDFFCEYINEKPWDDGGILDLITSAANYANNMVYMLSKTDEKMSGMGTTFTACVVADDKVYVAHIGDSRLYSMADQELKQNTVDHSYVEQMVKAGQMTHEQAKRHPRRNMLTRALGVDPEITVDSLVIYTEGISMLLLCSDGLTNMLTDDDIADILNCDIEPELKAAELIDEANRNGGLDNISVILIDFFERAAR